MTPEVVALVSATGTTLNAAYAWPQVARAARTTAGLATGTVLLGWASRLAWSCYAITRHDLGLLAGQAPPALAFFTLVALVIVRRPAQRARVATSFTLLSAVILAVAAHPHLLAAVAIATTAMTAVPQLLVPLTRDTAVSGYTYVLAAAASATWLSYGLLTANPTVYLTHALVLPTSSLLAIRIGLIRRGRPSAADS